MGLLKDRTRRTAPLKMLILGLFLIGLQAYLAAGSGAVQFMVGFSLKKLLIQVPAGSSRFGSRHGSSTSTSVRSATLHSVLRASPCWPRE